MKIVRRLGISVCFAALAACATPQADAPVVAAVTAPPAEAPPSPPTPPAPEKPSAPADLLAKLPEAYWSIFGQVKLTDDAQADQLRKQTPDRLFNFFNEQIVRQKPGAAEQLAAIYPKETSVQLKQHLLENMPLRGANESPEVRQFMVNVASSDPNLQLSMLALRRLDSAAQADLIAALRKREQAANTAGDDKAARQLRDQIDHYRYRDVTLPKYAYRAAAAFSATPAKTTSIRVLAFGDFGTGSKEQVDTAKAMQAFHKKTPFTFGITLGDNFYGSGLDDPANLRWKTQWEDLYSPLKIPFYATFGNHDVTGDSVAAELAYAKISKSWKFPSPYYTYTAGPAQFFAIDTQRLTDDQLDWLDGALKASKAQWKIVYGHYQIYSATRGDNDAGQADLVHKLLPILTRNHVDVYLCGHDHNLQELAEKSGLHFFVMGAGGADLYGFDQENYGRSVFKSSEHGFGVVEVSPKAMTISLVGLDGKPLHSTTFKH
jgi:hypothetical protein